MESTINTVGLISAIWWNTFSKVVSVRMKIYRFSFSIVLAHLYLLFTFFPLTYKTVLFLRCNASWSNKVDFPIPGSPPINTSELGTIPPPKTRFSSLSEVRYGVHQKYWCHPGDVVELLWLFITWFFHSLCSALWWLFFHVRIPLSAWRTMTNPSGDWTPQFWQ